ncbi:MAG: AAA family ATPase [Bacteroidales bacterium]|nr:AAA family ATPase [Bacteroidales bacterium]
MIEKNNFFILTGGPGAGKTSLIEELKNRKYNCVPEVGRKIIKEQMETDGNALPWKDVKLYSSLMLTYSLHDFNQRINSNDIYFFDRGIPDVYGYERLMKLPDNPRLQKTVKEFRYNPVVFILPPWKQIYENDKEWKQDFEEAKATYEIMCEIYKELEYELTVVPEDTVLNRVNFIMDKIKN